MVMKRILKLLLVPGLALTMMLGTMFYAPQAGAVEVVKCDGIETGDHVPAICDAKNDKLFGTGSIWSRIINTLLIVIGAAAVLAIIIGAIRYTTSGGDQSSITSAKNTILYAIIGLIIALMAGGLVNFVLVNV